MDRMNSPDNRREALRDALKRFGKVAIDTVQAGALAASLGAPQAQAQVQKATYNHEASVEKSAPGRIHVLSKQLFERSAEKTARKMYVRSVLGGQHFSQDKLESVLLESRERTLQLWNGLFALNEKFEPVLSKDAVEVRVPGGELNTLKLASSEKIPRSSFEVTYHVTDKSGLTRPYVFQVTARHNLPPDAKGWAHHPSADISAKRLRLAGAREDLPHFTGKRTTDSLIGELGTTTAPSQSTQELSEDHRPLTGEILPLAALRAVYEFDDSNMRKGHPHMDFQLITNSGGFCMVLPTEGVNDIEEVTDANFWRSGSAARVVDLRTNQLNEIVGVSSFAWPLRLSDGKGGRVQVQCYSGPEQLKLVLDEAAKRE